MERARDKEKVSLFRWNLVRRDKLGMLLDGCVEPDLWFLDALIEAAAKVLGRSADGDLYFVGRSLDSMYDLLGGALDETSWSERLRLLPFSFRWSQQTATDLEVRAIRQHFADHGLSPYSLARRRRPVVFVDLVYIGGTFESLYHFLRGWIDEESAQWDVIRRKLRFVGVTEQEKTSPKTWRWQQQLAWTDALPARAITNVSIHRFLWSYLGDHQTKLTESFRQDRWTAAWVDEPKHDDRTRAALAEAVAIVAAGRTRETRLTLARHIQVEPMIRHSWLRSLAGELRK